MARESEVDARVRAALKTMNPEERKALGQWVAQLRRARPHIAASAQSAKDVYQKWLESPQWAIQEGPRPDQMPSQDLWSIGAPQVNYVDKIEGQP